MENAEKQLVKYPPIRGPITIHVRLNPNNVIDNKVMVILEKIPRGKRGDFIRRKLVGEESAAERISNIIKEK